MAGLFISVELQVQRWQIIISHNENQDSIYVHAGCFLIVPMTNGN